MIDYIALIGEKYPSLQVSCFGDSSVYENLVAENGNALPSKDELDSQWLTYCQEQMWLKIKKARDDRKSAGIKVGENWFHSDDASRIQQIALTMLGSNLPAGIMWKTMTGSFVEMTPALASSIFTTNIYYDKMNFAVAETHRQNMLKAADPLSYDYSSGWLTNFVEAHQATLSPTQLRDALS